MGALAVQPASTARTYTPDALTASTVATTPEQLVDLAIATMEWDDSAGLLSLLQRDAARTTFQMAFEPEGALLGVLDGVGDEKAVSVITPTAAAESTTLGAAVELPDAAVEPPGAVAEARQEAQRLAREQAAREARRVQQRAERRAERQAERRAERQAQSAERRADRQAQRRAERRAERREERRAAPSRGAWNNAPIVTWYGPGFYGNRTACGQRYSRKIIGVAHRTLPCGTMVQFRWKGITATAPVIDRGPYATSAHVFDFSAALSCDVFRPRGVANGCFTRNDVAWRVVSRPD